MRHYLFCFVCSLFFSVCIFANDLEVSGIMQGARPMAIVNGRPIGVEDTVSDAKVIAINADHVVFEKNGQSITRTLTTPTQTAKPKTSITPTAMPAAPSPLAMRSLGVDNLRNEYSTALNQIQNYLKATPKAIKTYDQALRLYDDLDRQVQAAIAQISDGGQITFMRGWLKDISERKSNLYSQKSQLSSAIDEGKRDKNPVRGMTKDDIRLALGNPDNMHRYENESRNLEDWNYYNQTPGYYLRLEDGILTEISASREAPPTTMSGEFKESQKKAQDGFQSVRDSFKF